MGWFGLTSDTPGPAPSPSAPPPSNDGGYIAPDRTSRARCWEGRDKFFECLDRNDILDSVKEDEKARKACPQELKEFEANCASSWVAYFKKRRVFEYQKEQTLRKLESEGAEPMAGREKKGSAAASALRGK